MLGIVLSEMPQGSTLDSILFNKYLNKVFLWLTRTDILARPSSFLAFLVALRSSYIIIQSSFTSFSSKTFRLIDLDINSK